MVAEWHARLRVLPWILSDDVQETSPGSGIEPTNRVTKVEYLPQVVPSQPRKNRCMFHSSSARIIYWLTWWYDFPPSKFLHWHYSTWQGPIAEISFRVQPPWKRCWCALNLTSKLLVRGLITCARPYSLQPPANWSKPFFRKGKSSRPRYGRILVNIATLSALWSTASPYSRIFSWSAAISRTSIACFGSLSDSWDIVNLHGSSSQL
jgi:hypothetical protein